jgi:putative transposase
MKYKNTYRIETNRLKNNDYGAHGFYFVTICTKNKEYYFGHIIPVETQNFASLQPTEIGNTAYHYWTEIPKHFPFVALDEFIIMPITFMVFYFLINLIITTGYPILLVLSHKISLQ